MSPDSGGNKFPRVKRKYKLKAKYYLQLRGIFILEAGDSKMYGYVIIAQSLSKLKL